MLISLRNAAAALGLAAAALSGAAHAAEELVSSSIETVLDLELSRAAIGGVAIAAFADGDAACAIRPNLLADAAAQALRDAGVVAYLNGPAAASTADPIHSRLELIVRAYPDAGASCIAVLEACNAGLDMYDDPIVFYDAERRENRNFSLDGGKSTPFARRWKSCVGAVSFTARRGELDAKSAEAARTVLRSYAADVIRAETALLDRFGDHFRQWRTDHHARAARQFGF